MSVRTDVINLNVNINGDEARNKLNELRKRAADVKLEMDGLKKGTQAYIDKKKELSGVTAEMDKLKKSMGLAALTQKELIQELSRLKSLRGSVTPFSDEYKKLDASIKQVENRLYDVKNGVQGFSSFLSKIKDEVKQFGLMAVGFLGFQFLSQQFTNIISGGGRLSDQLADIRRVTSMTDEEVKKLNKSLGEVETRTSTGGLRDIAIIAGKLGVAKDDILDFVKATDMLVVALGDELGDADQITTQLGKILNVFDGKVNGENITTLGNAIVDLANKGVASGSFIVDFTQRLAGLAQSANIGLNETVGLAAGLEELGQRSESSSTAVVKMIGAIGQDIPKYAKIANKSVEQFSKTMRETPVEALLQVSEGLTKGKGSFEEISKAFDDAGEDGARIISVLGTLGNRAEFVREKITVAGSALENTDQITAAFALKNETLGATLDKLSKEFNKITNSQSVNNFLKSAAEGVFSFLKSLRELPAWVERNTVALTLLTIGIATLNRQYIISAFTIARDTVAKTYNAIVTKGTAIASTIATAAQAAYIVVTNAATGAITVATAAQRLWNIALSIGAGPIGILLALVGALIVAFNRQSAAAKMAADIQERIAESTTEQISKINTLKSVINDSNVSLDNRKKALQALINIAPEYLNGLTLENMKTSEGKKLLDGYIDSLVKKAEIEAKNAVLVEKLKSKEKAAASLRQMKGFENMTDEQLESYASSAVKSRGSNLFGNSTEVGGVDLEQLMKDFKDIKVLQADVTTAARKNVEDVVGKVSTAVTTATTTTVKSIKDQIKALDDAYELINIKDKAALQKNRADKARLQSQLDGMETKKKGGKADGNNEYDQLKKDAAQFAKDVKKLRQQIAVGEQDADQQEVLRIQQKYEELQGRALAYFKKNITSQKEYNQQKKDIDELFHREMQTLFNKQFEQTATKEYEQSLQFASDYYDEQKVLAGKNYADGVLTKKQYEAKLKQIETDETDSRVRIAEDYKGTVKKAAADVTKFKKEQEKEQTADAVAETEKRVETSNNERLAKAKLEVRVSRPGSDGRLEAQQQLLDLEFQLKTASWDKESEQYKLAVQERLDAERELVRQANLEKIDMVMEYVGYFQSALQSLNTIISNRENRMLNEDRRRNDIKKKTYKQQLDDKLISQSVYDKKVAEADEELDRKKRELQRKQAAREKAINIFNAIVSNAAAILKTMSSIPYPLNIPLAIAQGIAGGLQIAAIASTPLPELGKGAWVRDGDKHTAPSGGINAKIERGEAVMSAAAMEDPNQYTITGTAAQITSALNSMNGGVNWSGGAVVNMMDWLNRKSPSINPNMPKIMEQGGVVRPLNQEQKTDNNNEVSLIAKELAEMKSFMQEWPTKIRGNWVIRELDDTRKIYDDAKKASGLNQK